MEAEAACLAADMNYPHTALLSAADTRGQVATAYHGGLLDRGGGHMHPLNYTLGLAAAVRAAGVAIYEGSVVSKLTTGGGVRVETAGGGAVQATHAVLAGDALLQGLCSTVNDRIMPVANYVAATRPLDDPAALIAHDVAVSDSRFVVNYYRLSADGRLIFGGGERYTPEPPADIACFVRGAYGAGVPAVARRRRSTTPGAAWCRSPAAGLPHVGRRGEVLFAHGYSGLGVVLSTLAGKLLVEALLGSTDRFERFASLEPPAFPGGVALRGPLHVLGMLWYALRDRL